MWNKPLVVAAALVLALGGVGTAIYVKLSAPRLGYVKMKDVFEKFEMKKEMELKFQRDNGWRQRQLDSLSFALQQESNRLKGFEAPPEEDLLAFNVKQNDFLGKRQQLEADKQIQTEALNTQIVTRMEQYIRDYGQQNGYTYIFGDDGNGYLMYSEDAQDVTAPVLTYINERYAGQK